MKLFKFFAVAELASAQACTLFEATCSHEGFSVKMNEACRSSNYPGVQVDEVFASGPDQSAVAPAFGEPTTEPCRFGQLNVDGTYTMNFPFTACGTDSTSTTADHLVYKNTIQANEYYPGEITMGTYIRYTLTCNAIRNTDTSSNVFTIQANAEFTQDSTQEAGDTWVDELIVLEFYETSDYTTEITATTFGKDVYAAIKLDDTNAGDSWKLRATECWATNTQEATSTPKMTLFENSCSSQDKPWVTIESNGESAISKFSFRSFIFPNSQAAEIYLHCNLYICPSADTCTTTCTTGRRRRQAVMLENGFTRLSNGTVIQDNGLPAPRIITAKLDVTDPAFGGGATAMISLALLSCIFF